MVGLSEAAWDVVGQEKYDEVLWNRVKLGIRHIWGISQTSVGGWSHEEPLVTKL